MKTYVITLGYDPYFYPPLTPEQKKAFYEKQLYQILRQRVLADELVIKEELALIGKAIIDASDKSAKQLRKLGFHLVVKKTK